MGHQSKVQVIERGGIQRQFYLIWVRLFWNKSERRQAHSNVWHRLLLDQPQSWALLGSRRGWHFAVCIERLVIPLMLADFMEAPVLVEVVAGAQGSESEDGFGT